MTIVTRPTFNGIQMVDGLEPQGHLPMWNRGRFRWLPPEREDKNGNGIAVFGGLWSIQWAWPYLWEAEWRWWVVTILAGATSLQCDINIWNNNDLSDSGLTTYADAVIYYPVNNGFDRGKCHGVVLSIGQLIPTLPTIATFAIGLSAIEGDDIIAI